MRKNVLFTVLLLSLMGLHEKVQAQYFSAISPSGHTLYYEVINETNHWVEVTNPNHSYRWDSWTNYSTPYGNVIVPPTVNWNGIDWTVRHIGHDAFFDCQTIQGLTLPEGIDSIKEYALYNINIDTLVIPSTVTFIGQGLFNCPRMHYLTIPASVQQIAHEWGEGGSILGINVAEGNPYYRSIDGCLVRQTNDIVELMVFPRARFQNVDSVVIPEGVTKIDFPVQEGIYKHKLIVPSTMTYLRLSNDNENGYAYDTIVFQGMMPPALIDNNGTIGYVQRFELPCGARRSYSVTAWGQYADRFFTNNYLTQREYSHTIAYGESYPWGDNTLTERGVYEDTLLSVVEGCDSLHRVLTLNVVQNYRDDITLNSQLPAYNYHGLNVDKPGIYEVTVSSEGDFDSLFILRASAEVNSTVATVALGGIFDGQSFNLPAMENRQLVRGVDTITVTNVHQILYDTVDVTIAEGSSYYGHTLAGVYQDTIYAADYDSVVRSRVSMNVNRPLDSCTVQLGGNQGGTYFAGDEFYTAGTEISVEPSKSKTLQYTPDVLGENLLPFYSMEENDCFSNYQSQYIGDYLTAPNAGVEIWGDRGVDNSPCMMFGYSTAPDQAFFRTSLSTKVGEKYNLSFMASSSHNDIAIFVLKVNGILTTQTDTLVCCNQAGLRYFEHIIEATSDVTTIELINVQMEPGPYGIGWYIDNMSLTKVYSPTEDTITITNTHGMVYDTVDVSISEGESYRGYTLAGVYQDTVLGTDADSIIRSRISMTVNRPVDNCTVQLGGNQGGTYFAGDEFYTVGTEISVEPSKSKTLQYTSDVLGENLLELSDMEEGNYVGIYRTLYAGDYLTAPLAEIEGFEDRGVNNSRGLWFRGTTDPGKAFFRTILPTAAGEKYYFHFNAANGHPSYAVLALKVNGEIRYPADTLINGIDNYYDMGYIIEATSDTTTIELENLQIVLDPYLGPGMYEIEWYIDNMSLTKVYSPTADSITITNTHGLVRDTVDVTIVEGENYRGHTLAGVYCDTIFGADIDSIFYARVSMDINYTFGVGTASVTTNQEGRLWMGLDDEVLTTEQGFSVQLQPTEERRYVLTSMADGSNLEPCGDFENDICNMGDYIQGNIPFQGSLYYTPCDTCGHTGKGVAVKGSVVENKAVYRTNYIGLPAEHRYSFSYWAKSHTANNPALLVLQINGNYYLEDTVNLADAVGEWKHYEHIFTVRHTYYELSYVGIVDVNLSENGNEFFLDDISLVDLTEAEDAHRDTITLRNTHEVQFATVDVTLNESESYNGHTLAGVYNDTLVMANHDSITHSRISYVINHPVGEGITSLATSDGLWIDLDSNSLFTEDSLSVDPMQTRTFGLLVPASDTNLIVNGDFELGDTGFTSHYYYGFLFYYPQYDVGRYIICEWDVNQYILALNYWPYQGALYVTTANVTPNTWYKLSYRGESSVLRGDVSTHPYGNDNTVVVNGEQIGNDSLTYSSDMNMTQGETFTHYFYNSEGTTVSIELNSNYEGDYYFAYDDITLTPLTVSDTITITNRHQLVYDTLRADICQGDVYTVDSVDYSIAGTYTLDTRYYADSTVYPTLILAVHDNYYPQLEEAICEGESYAFGGDSLTVMDVYVDSLTTVWGCDSIVTLNLTVHSHTASVQNEDVCDSYFWTVNNTRLVTGGQYIDTISNVHGCDSVCTLNLTVRYSTTGDTSATACDRFSWYGHTYTASGMPTHTLTNAVGCDSTLTLHLTVNHSTSGSETFTVCDSLTWHDSLYTVSGTYQDRLSNSVGCDSVVTLYLTVNSTYQHTDAVFACDNQLPYMYHEQPLNTAGDHAVYFQSVAGCDSTVTVTLTVGATYQHSDQLALCQSGMPYTYGDRTFLEDDTTGVYTIPFSSVEGCDSIISLDLTVHESEATEIYVVTVQATNNLVLWQPAAAVESYRIYRESSTSGIYSLMVEVPYDEGGSWLDTESDARQHSYRYRMTSVDSCGVESEQSSIHRTMHLTINQGVGNSWNLVWTEYQGTTYSTYRIFRGTSYDNMQMIGEIPSDNTTFTDNNAPEGYVYYQIVVLLSAPGAKDASNEIRSNVATNDQTGIGSVAEGYLNVYQQNGDIVVETTQGQPLQVYDLSGRKLFDVISTGVDRFEVPVTGVYLIRVEGMKAHRIVVEK